MTNTINTIRNALPLGFALDAEYGLRLNLASLSGTRPLEQALSDAADAGIEEFFAADSSYARAGHFFQLIDGRWECLPMGGAKLDAALVAACEQSAVVA